MQQTENRIDHSLTPGQAHLYQNNSLFHAAADALWRGADALDVIGNLAQMADALQHGAIEAAQRRYQKILEIGRPRHG